MAMVAAPEHLRAAAALRELIAAHAEVDDLLSIGAYKAGTKPLADRAIARWDRINEFLRQDRAEATPFDATVATLQEITSD
jgi:flagellar biosynthesis/type III secretory pathway ATPase